MKKTFYITLSIILIVGINSCKKKGCTDKNASNYNYLAKKEDGTCQNLTNGNLGPMLLDCSPFASSSYYLKNDPNRKVDYLVTCNVNINSPIIIESGVVIEFSVGSGLIFSDDVTAIGTASEPIIFRSSSNQKGSWRGITLTGANSINQTFDYVSIENATYAENIGGTPSGSSLRISNGSSTNITNCTISGSTAFGLKFMSASNTNTTINNLTIKDCESALILPATSLVNVSNLTLTNNTNNYIDLYADTYGTNISIFSSQYPYRVAYGYQSFDNLLSLSNSSATFYVAAGVTMRFGNGFGINCSGNFNAQGTASNWIKFLSTSPVAGGWRGLSLNVNNNKNIDLNYVEVGYALTSSLNTSIYIGTGGSSNITNSYIHDGSCGIYNQGSILVTTGTTFTNVTQNICP